MSGFIGFLRRKRMREVYNLSFPKANSIVVSGDIHGDFNLLVHKLCVQYQMKDTVLVVAGDCGFGFEKKAYYEQMVRRNAKRMNDANNWIVFVRGNHDNPAYFDGKQFKHRRFVAVPDYSVISTCKHTILCIGGGISIDRNYRIDMWKMYCAKHGKDGQSQDKLDKNFYWSDEVPVYDEEMLNLINEQYAVDIVISHTAPDFCEQITKRGLYSFAASDEKLLEDVDKERATMTKIYGHIVHDVHPLSHWYYGHFHQSWHSDIDGVLFKMLDVMEFTLINE